MPSKTAFAGKHVGQAVWQHASWSKDAWRACTVKTITQPVSDYAMGNMGLQQMESKKQVTVYSGSYKQVLPFDVAPHIPPHTIYLIGTKIGEKFNWRFNLNFEVYECCTRLITRGLLLGFLVVPAYSLSACEEIRNHPLYQTWMVGPKLAELFSFLGNKLPEITAVHEAICGQQEASVSDNHVQAT